MPSSSSTQCSPAGIRAKRSGTNSRAMQGAGARYWRSLHSAAYKEVVW